MITVISGTNREGNMSVRVASKVMQLLTAEGKEAQLLDLKELPIDFVFRNDVFNVASLELSTLVEKYITDAQKFIFIIPEYNGGIPGVCKAFIDAVKPSEFRGKQAALVGLSSGRAGNLRGTDQLISILNYLNVTTVPKPVNILHIDKYIDDSGSFNDVHTEKALDRLIASL